MPRNGGQIRHLVQARAGVRISIVPVVLQEEKTWHKKQKLVVVAVGV